METFLTNLLGQLGLTEEQKAAAAERNKNTVVTAGAGSGKTRTLVARYLGLLSEGLHPRQVVAVTFTEKAAREMLSRTRQFLRNLMSKAEMVDERQRWASLDSQMDSARIGTIHSLCAEILRNHPASARLDPRFMVVEENQTAALRAQAVEEAIAWAVQQPEMENLFRVYSLNPLSQLLSNLLSKRLEVTPESFDPKLLAKAVLPPLKQFLSDETTISLRSEFTQARTDHSLIPDAGEKLGDQIITLLARLDSAEGFLKKENAFEAARELFLARRENMKLSAGKKGRIKEALKELQVHYDLVLNPWLGGAQAKDSPPDAKIEDVFEQSLPLIARLFEQAQTSYHRSLEELNGLDFDDLESKAVLLLRDPVIKAYWQVEVSAILVDEFQDTNARQREIVLALCGEEPGRLFVVGDARQSIYRFRGADVTVFTSLQDETRRQGGQTLDLDRTYRSHPDLLAGLGTLLSPIMGSQTDPIHPYQIPYSPLRAERKAERKGIQAPFIECIIGAGEDAFSGRTATAKALAHRLNKLHDNGEILSWEEVALLFRASTAFPIYEQALEEAGIPFVTVAGSGFYDRPEVRDVLNLLRALADPWDDQALAGLLRSPAFGVSDIGLYQLRILDGVTRPLMEAVRGDLTKLSSLDRENVLRARDIIEELEPLVNLLPVAVLLEKVVARTDYRAILATAGRVSGNSRLWRNVDKLVADAQTSQMTSVRGFLEYVNTMRDIGAREGEAASEAEGSVRLMTIHKAKGLEFPFVVLADASRRKNSKSEPAFRLGNAWTLSPDKLEGTPLSYRLAITEDSLQDDAEEKRLLYVALTRAKEKLIINGHLRLKDEAIYADGWLGALLEAGGILPGSLLVKRGDWQKKPLIGKGEWALWLSPEEAKYEKIAPLPKSDWPETTEKPLFERIETADSMVRRVFYEHRTMTAQPRTPPARVVGEMVHKALQHWCFNEDSRFESLLRTQAQNEGLVEEDLVVKAIRETISLLQRFQQHAMYAEMDSALERHHEVPFQVPAPNGSAEWGFIDCLYHTDNGWTLVDFKTDEIRGKRTLEAAIEEYRPQLLRYKQVAEQILGSVPRSLMCFLNVEKAVKVVEVE